MILILRLYKIDLSVYIFSNNVFYDETLQSYVGGCHFTVL